jgi:hypothetical protein
MKVVISDSTSAIEHLPMGFSYLIKRISFYYFSLMRGTKKV